MPITAIPSTSADADYPLCSGVLVDLEENLETTYEQSGFDICALYTEWYVDTAVKDDWEVPEGGLACPIPLRRDTDGTWHTIEVSMMVKVIPPLPLSPKTTFTIRLYVLPYGSEPAVDATDAIVDETAYDEQSFSDETWTLIVWTIKPRLAQLLYGDGSTDAEVAVGWLHILSSCDQADANLVTASIRVREVVA